LLSAYEDGRSCPREFLHRQGKLTRWKFDPVVRRETLIAMKRSAAHPQDLVDIAELEKIEKLKESASK
jgi:hypothetical protein